jgi:hypothetical protein
MPPADVLLRCSLRRLARACLVRAAAVVDDRHVAGLCPAKCFQEHVHAAVVPHGQHPRDFSSTVPGSKSWNSDVSASFPGSRVRACQGG